MTSDADTVRTDSEFAPRIDVALYRGEPSPPAKKPDMRQLTDQCELVFERMSNATACAKQLHNFYQKLSEIEGSYASSLCKLAQQTQFSGSESLQTALSTLLVSVEIRASIHTSFSNELQQKLAKEMNELSTQMKKERAQTRSVWAESEKSLKNQTSAVEKHFQRYLHAVRDGEKEVSSKNEAALSTVKSATKHDKKIQEAVSRYRCRKEAYGDAVSTYGKVRAQYAKTCSYILANIEATDISRLHKIQASLECYQQKMRELLEKSLPPVEMLSKSVNAMDPIDDVTRFVEQNRTDSKDKLPPVMEFVEIRTDLEEDTTKLSVSDVKSRSSGSEGSDMNHTMKAYAITNSMGQLDLKPGLLSQKQDVEEKQDLFYLTLYEYSSDQNEVLSFVVGEFIRMEGNVPESDGWAWGLLNGNVGMFPTTYCQSFFPQKCIAICDFNLGNSEPDQLRVRAGEPIWILHISDQHWVWAADGRGIQGNFPSTYCKPPPRPTDV